MPGSLDDLAIFPLGAVLFPGGVLPLRVFEARYMDAMRQCMQHGTPFGVCLITNGAEVGEPAEHEPVGCLATITDWDMPQLGVLQLRTRGGERFRIASRRVQDDRLVRARVEPIAPDPLLAVPESLAICADLLRRIIEDHVGRAPDPKRRVVDEPYAYESASWVGNRLAEFLPISPRARQKLMELDDPLARLSLVHRFLQRQKVI